MTATALLEDSGVRASVMQRAFPELAKNMNPLMAYQMLGGEGASFMKSAHAARALFDVTPFTGQQIGSSTDPLHPAALNGFQGRNLLDLSAEAVYSGQQRQDAPSTGYTMEAAKNLNDAAKNLNAATNKMGQVLSDGTLWNALKTGNPYTAPFTIMGGLQNGLQ